MNPRALDTFGRASQDVTDAYILWVLTSTEGFSESEYKEQIRNLEKISFDSYDPYVLGLASGTFFNINKLDLAKKYAERIVPQQNKTSGAV